MSSEKAGDGSPDSGFESGGGSFLAELVSEISGSWVNMILLAVTAYLLYKIVRGWLEPEPVFTPPPPRPPPMKRRDMVLSELRKFDGKDDGPVLLAVNGNIFNVSRGRRFYGPGGPYEDLAGHDATRAFAKFQTDLVSEDYEDLSDLTAEERSQAKDWEEQMAEKYEFVGKLIRPQDQPTLYSDDEGDNDKETAQAIKTMTQLQAQTNN